MIKIIEFCDFLGFSPQLHVSNNETYQSTVTGVLSIIVAIISLLCAGYFGSELILKSSPSVVVTSQMNDDFGPLNVSNTGFMFLLGMQDQNGVFYVDPSIFAVEAIEETLKNEVEDGKLLQNYYQRNLTVDLCSEFYKDEDILETNVKVPLGSVYCIKPNESKIRGYWGTSGEFSTVKMTFKKCVNTTTDSKCKSDKEITKAIQNGYISMDFSYHAPDQRNVSSPLKRAFLDDYNLLNADSTIFYRYHLNPIKFLSDEGILFQNNYESLGWELDTKLIIQNVKSEEIVSVIFQGNSESKVFLRSYTKLQTVLTQIGGFVKAIMLVANFFAKIFSKTYYFTDLLFNTMSGSINKEDLKPLDSQIVMSLHNLKRDKINNSLQLNNLRNPDNNLSVKHRPLTFLKKNEGKLNSLKLKKETFENQGVKNNLEHLKSSKRSDVLCSYFLNYVTFCKKWPNRSISYKYIDTLNNLYKKITSIEIISNKFFESELIKKTLLDPNLESDIVYNQVMFATLSELENYNFDSKEIFFIEKKFTQTSNPRSNEFVN